jgi:hypothetical protein
VYDSVDKRIYLGEDKIAFLLQQLRQAESRSTSMSNSMQYGFQSLSNRSPLSKPSAVNTPLTSAPHGISLVSSAPHTPSVIPLHDEIRMTTPVERKLSDVELVRESFGRHMRLDQVCS